MASDNATAGTVHPFERSGLGVAPFRFLGLTVEVGPIRLPDGITAIGSPGQPMGTCDHCGQGIKYVCHIGSADGKRFKVGCDCVRKLARASNCKTDPVIRAIADARRKKDREARQAREAKAIAEGRARFEANRAALEAMPHPQEWRAEKGESYADSVDWMMKNAGNAGKLRVLAAVGRILDAQAGAAEFVREVELAQGTLF